MTASPVAIVTGATGGMGSAVVRDLARDHDVVALGRNREALELLAAETGARVRIAELTDPTAVAAAVADLDRVDVLVHAAAVGDHLSVAEAGEEDWRLQLDTNVIAPALLTRAVLPRLRESSGTVVFVGSGAGTRPVPGSAVYAASKHALRAVADVLRIDEEPHRVRVATVAPGQTDTPMLRRSVSRSGRPYTPERYVRPESVAAAIRFVVDAPEDVHITDVPVRPRQEISRL